MNGKGDKYRVKWSKDYEENYNKIFKETDMQINRKYIKEVFKQNGVQLSKESMEDIVRHLRMTVSRMGLRCKEGNVKRLTPEIFWIAIGKPGNI